MKKIFITRKIPKIAEDRLLEKKFQVTIWPDAFLPREELFYAVRNYDGIVSMLSDPLDEQVLANATQLQAISNYAVGLDNIDVECAQKLGIAVYHLPHVVTNSTADLTLGLLLVLVRNICQANAYVRGGYWKGWSPDLFVGEELSGKTLGIIGFGRIGQAVATRALSFGMKVVFSALSKKVVPQAFATKAVQVGQEELFATADVISLHIPLTPTTRGMIDLASMRKMKKKPFLLNMARGSIIKTEDLVVALQEGLLQGAALDVTDPEPLDKDHPLFFLRNCFIVPHIGTATKECRWNMAKIAAENLIVHFETIRDHQKKS